MAQEVMAPPVKPDTLKFDPRMHLVEQSQLALTQMYTQAESDGGRLPKSDLCLHTGRHTHASMHTMLSAHTHSNTHTHFFYFLLFLGGVFFVFGGIFF